MGCRTGFYFLTRNTVSGADAIRLVQETLQYVLTHRRDPRRQAAGMRQLSGSRSGGAKAMAREYQPILTNWTPQQLNYPAEVLTGTASV
ncbi:MAG: S-ribosylhomocysteine lyase [Ruminococcus callidus]